MSSSTLARFRPFRFLRYAVTGVPRVVPSESEAEARYAAETRRLLFNVRGSIQEQLEKRTHLDPGVIQLASTVGATAVYGIGALTLAGTLGIDTTPLLASLGVSSAVAGFAVKDIATNSVSGVSLLVSRPFEIGDKVTISIKEGSVTGIVKAVSIRNVTLITPTSRIVIPSSTVLSAPITVHNSDTEKKV
jgi:small-conductance mechanosensitive channel